MTLRCWSHPVEQVARRNRREANRLVRATIGDEYSIVHQCRATAVHNVWYVAVTFGVIGRDQRFIEHRNNTSRMLTIEQQRTKGVGAKRPNRMSEHQPTFVKFDGAARIA